MELTWWSVVTGAPGSGKSTVIAQLERWGYSTAPEVARAYLSECVRAGRTVDDVIADQPQLQRIVAFRAREAEERLVPSEAVFLDRALPDSIGYCKFAGIDPAPLIPSTLARRYRGVFLFEPLLGFAPPPSRYSEDESRRLATCIESAYVDLGYDVIHVPIMSVSERAEFVLRFALPEGSRGDVTGSSSRRASARRSLRDSERKL